MKEGILLTCLFFYYCFAHGQSEAQSAFQIAIEINKKAPENYLAPIIALKNIEVESDDFLGKNTWLQANATYYSFLGDYRQTLYWSDQRFLTMIDSVKIECDTTFFEAHQLVDAKEYVLDRAKLEHIVMLNEAHHIPYHRAFTLTLLKEMYHMGYHYLALETLEDTAINKTKIVTNSTGYYTREPVFGELLRYALKLGFELVSYEPEQSCENKGTDQFYCNRFRDSLMAVNVSKIINQDPDAKILIHAGYDHINEGSKNGWTKMASFLEDMTGINPLTISQTKQIEFFYPQFETKEFTAVTNLGDNKTPVVAVNEAGSWHDPFVDISIFHPRYLIDDERPRFYDMGGMRRPYFLDPGKYKEEQFVQAFYRDETPGHRIPADQLQVGGNDNYLYLFPGNYVLEVKDQKGDGIRQEQLTIE